MPKTLLLALAAVGLVGLAAIGIGYAFFTHAVVDDVQAASHADLDSQPVKGLTAVVLRAPAADVHVHAELGPQARLVATRVGRGRTAAEAAARADAIAWKGHREGGTWHIDAAALPGTGDLGTQLAGGPYALTFELYLPAGPALDVEVGTGDLGAAAVRGTTRLVTGTGDVEATGVTGDLTATAGTGDVVVRQGRGATIAEAGTGNVTLRDRPGPVARLQAGTGDLEWAYTAEPPATNGLTTGTGSITLRVPKALGFALALDAETGAITDRAGFRGAIVPQGAGAHAELTAGAPAGKPAHVLKARTTTGNVVVEGPLAP